MRRTSVTWNTCIVLLAWHLLWRANYSLLLQWPQVGGDVQALINFHDQHHFHYLWQMILKTRSIFLKTSTKVISCTVSLLITRFIKSNRYCILLYYCARVELSFSTARLVWAMYFDQVLHFPFPQKLDTPQIWLPFLSSGDISSFLPSISFMRRRI